METAGAINDWSLVSHRRHDGRLLDLSRQAVSYGLELRRSHGTSGLWERLYNFNSYPERTHPDMLTPTDEPGESFVAHLLEQVGPDWAWTQRTDPRWIFLSQPCRREAAHSARRRNGHYKIYVSPIVGAFRHTVGAALAALSDCAVLKFARKHNGTLRPDKIVIYTDSMAHTRRVAGRLLAAVGETRAQGVPFTAELGGDGLLSWAMDPGSTEFRRFSSWRVWISHALVTCINAAPVLAEPEVQVNTVLRALARQHGVVSGRWMLESVRRKWF
jgi:hypothetical protein